MKKYRIKVDKGANAKVVFRGLIVEIKKINDEEVEIIVPEGVRIEELASYLHKFNVIKPSSSAKLEPASEPKDSAEQKENNNTHDQQDQVTTDEQEENERDNQASTDDNKDMMNEEVKDMMNEEVKSDEATTEDQKQKISTRKRKRQ